VVAATLSLALRATSSAASDVIYLGSTNNSFTFSSLGWLPIGTGTNTTVGVLDLGSQLHLLTNGQFNVAVQGDAGIDWAMLELQVTPVQTLYTNSILPEADAYVRGGTNATLNFGTSTTIDVKADTSANTQRQGYLRWNLAGYSGSVLQARVRLTPISVGTNGLEHGITLTTSNQWSETTLNWNNQPGGCKRFATWIPAANVPVEFVVTPQVQAALAGDGQLSLELFSLSYVGGPGLVSYASREHGNSALRPQLLLIYSSTAPTLAASFYATPTNGGAPLPVVFTDTSTGEPTNYFWSFGDGATTNTTVTSLLHTYRFPGTNTVRLIVSGASGLSTNTQTNLIVATSVDSVGDGIPDWWRAQYFGGDGTTTNQSSCATCDPDGDGQSNSAEFLPLGGTDPTNSSSVFRITAINRIGSDLRVTWTVVTDKTYAVQVATDELNGSLSNSFVDLASVVVPPAPAIAETNYIDIGSATNAPARYYRLRLMP
jgi:PKD repeat protein